MVNREAVASVGKRKIRYGCFYFSLCFLLGMIVFSACGSEGTGKQNGENKASENLFQTAYLGKSDRELVRTKGKGIENIAVVDGKKVILSRVYQEDFLGYDSELTVMLSSGGAVEYGLYSLDGDREAVAAAISASLGKSAPDETTTGAPGVGFKAVWRQKPYLYTMIAEEDQVTVAIIKE